MKPLFTVHAGEYLVGSHIEAHYAGWNVWVPSKDTGIDLLLAVRKGSGVLLLNATETAKRIYRLEAKAKRKNLRDNHDQEVR